MRETVHTVTEIENALIKPRFNQLCLKAGLAIPETWYPDSLAVAAALAPSLPYPVMIKPRSHLAVGMYYRGSVVDDAAAFLRDFQRLAPAPGQEPVLERYPELCWPMVQRFEPSARQQVYSLCGLRDHRSGIVAKAAICKTDQWPPGVGIGTSFTSIDDPATFAAGEKLVNHFLRHSLFQIEFLVRGEERLAIDLNPRAYQMLTFDIARGNDLPWLWYCSTRGATLAPQPPARLGLVWRRNLTFHLGHWVRCLRGPQRLARWRRYRAQLAMPAVSASAGSPWWVRVAYELRMFRHPRSLVRPYWRERDNT